MATFLDRRALKTIFESALALRRTEGTLTEQTTTLYVAQGQKATGRGLLALRTVHTAAVETFRGSVIAERPDGLLALFRDPLDALRTALHALHSASLVLEFLEVPPCRIGIVRQQTRHDLNGPAIMRASKIAGRAEFGSTALEEMLYQELRSSVEGRSDIEVSEPRSSRLPGLGTLTTRTLQPIALRPEREREYIDVDEELRARPRR